MKILRRKNWENILVGANLLGTGGGGTMEEGIEILKPAKGSVQLVDLQDLKPNDIVCTIFGIGGKQACDPIKSSKEALEIFQKIYGGKISALIPVETGTVAIALSILIASKLKIPVLDSDIVGLRSSPEVYLETITIPNLDRTPCVVADDKGNSLVIQNNPDVEILEQKLREFAVAAGGDAYVAGYPLKTSSLVNVVPDGSLSISEQNGINLQDLRQRKLSIERFCRINNWRILGTGLITKVKNYKQGGFEQGEYLIKSEDKEYKIIFRNENIVLLEKNKVILTCPDSIVLLDIDNYIGVNNFEDNNGKKVVILAKKAIPIWRTTKGKKLFSPQNIGLNYEQVLMS